MRLLTLTFVVLLFLGGAAPPGEFTGALDREQLKTVFPGADESGFVEGTPPVAPVHREGRLVGYLFSSKSIVASTGFSGKPLDILIGLTLDGRIVGALLVEHHEPILIIGVSDADLEEFVTRFHGVDIRQILTVGKSKGFDAISSATVSSAVIADTILRSARIVARAKGIIEEPVGRGAGVDIDSFQQLSWSQLVNDALIQRLQLNNGQVATAFREPAPEKPDAPFFDLYAALLTPAMIGRNLLGDLNYNKLMGARKSGQQYIFLAANGGWSFKGTQWIRSGAFDRFQIVQGDNTFRLEKPQHRRLDKLRPEGVPELRESAMFTLPAAPALDPAKPWRVELMMTRADADGNPRRARFALTYTLPGSIETPNHKGLLAPLFRMFGDSMWLDIWVSRKGQIAMLMLALVVLTAILFLQDVLSRHPRVYVYVRYGFLIFTVVWLGWYAGAQLSVVNVLTFSQALLTGFEWELFLLDPLIFILWAYVAVAMLFWGRGVYCGWICPFGALQELLNRVARVARIPQITLPFPLHERLWPIKYIAFLVLFAISLGSMTLAVVGAEIEPFKTVISLGFQRSWPFVLYAVVLLGAGLFIQRFFCRYLCPLGAALAIPARLRMFDWLKRRPQCGTVCQACAVDCIVQAIHPDGRINPNECLYCLNCETLFFDEHRCPPLIERRKRRERRMALSSKKQPAS